MSPLISISGHERTPQHLPIGSLKFLGTNPYDEALFRVVWSESRYYIVGANHNDYDNSGPANDPTLRERGKDPNKIRVQREYRWLPLYPKLHRWVLECWKSPLAFTGCTKEQWDEKYLDLQSGLLILGPYPNRGEYSQCFTFPNEPSVSVVHDTIYRIKAGWNYSYNEHLTANKKEQEQKAKAAASQQQAIFKNAQQAFNNRPSNVRPGKRTAKDIKLNITADQTGIRSKRGISTHI